MRIGIDCIATDPTYAGGVNTYTFGLLSGFAKLKCDHSFVIFVSSTNKHLFDIYNEYDNFSLAIFDHKEAPLTRLIKVGGILSQSSLIWERVMNVLMRGFAQMVDSNCDVLYSPNTVLSSYNFRVPTLLSMHDIQQFHYPEFFTWKELMSRKVNFGASASNVQYLQASSEFIKRDLLHHFNNLREEQIVVINEGVNIEAFSKRINNEEVKNKYSLPDKFLFFPSQLWRHKNHLTVLKAIKILRERHNKDITLVLTGAKYNAYEEVVDFITENNLNSVKYLGKVPFEDLLQLYHNAYFLITAVLYESSSLPILEAAASGLSILASMTPPNIELSSKLKMNLFEPLDVKGLVDLILSLWDNEQERVFQIEQNLKAIHSFSWESIAHQYIDFIEKKIFCKDVRSKSL